MTSVSPAAGTSGDLLWPRYDRPEDLAAIEAVPLSERGLPAGTYEILTRAASLWPDRPAVTLLPSAALWERPVTWTYADLCDRVHRIGNALRGLGIGRRDAVALLSPNTGDVLAATLAAQAVGIAAPVNPALAPERVAELLLTSDAKVLVAAGPELDAAVWNTAVELARTVGPAALLAVRPDGADPGGAPPLDEIPGVLVGHLDELAAGQPADRLAAADRPAPGDPAAYFHTGGTTGTPKLAVHTHANEAAMAWSLAACGVLDEDSVLLAALPLFHVNAVLLTGLAPMMRGQHVVWAGPLGYRDPELYPVFWRLVERYRIAAMSAVPTVYAVLTRIPVDADISTLRFPVVGAAPLPESVRRAFAEHTGVPLCEGYGLTEATCASARGFPGDERAGSVGQRLPYQRIKAVRIDPGTGAWADLPPGETGVLAISGPTVFPGYLRRGPEGPYPDPAGKVVDGWLDTGDLGSVDADGFVHLTGRAKDLIIRGGHNIDPAGIEDALLSHPDVTAAAAVGRPDPHSGEVPVAYVTLRSGAAATAGALREWAAERVPEPAAAPRSVHVIDTMPLTQVGKQYKPALREDAVRRVVLAELEALGLPGLTVTVAHEDGRPTVTLAAPAGRQAAERLAATLDRYALAWRMEPGDLPAAHPTA